MKKLIVILGICLLVFFGCEKDVSVDVSECSGVYIEDSKIEIKVGEEKDINVDFEPSGTEDYNEVTYRIVNEKICELVFGDEKGCRIKGKKRGATVLVVSCGGLESKAILNVTDADVSRSIMAEGHSYMFTVSYKYEGGFATMCFIKEDPYDYSVADGKLYIVRDNGIKFYLDMDDLLDFSIDMIE